MTTANISYNGQKVVYQNSRLQYATDPYNPLNLPPFTIRVLLQDSAVPSVGTGWTQVSGSPNIWDYTSNNTTWRNLGLYGYLLEILGANTTGIETMLETFKGCGNLRRVEPFDMSTVSDAYGLFSGALSLTTAPNLDLSHVNRLAHMYEHCRSLVTVPTIDLTSATDINSMFCNGEYTTTTYKSNPNRVLQSVNFINANSVTNLTQLFSCCTALTSVTGLDSCQPTATPYMFDYCPSLVNIPTLDLSRTEYTQAMFRDDTGITVVPDYTVSAVTSCGAMFKNCTNVQSGALSLYNKLSQNTYAYTQKYYECFTNCGSNTTSGRAELAEIPALWGGTMST